MMRQGFIFDHNKCVNCNACSAACILENGWTVYPRNIYSYNQFAENILPVINLSLACNHCETASCMAGCPASAFYRDSNTGAVLIDDNKCIGCKYCQWNCPYDAPKLDILSKTMAKCHLCYEHMGDAGYPACSTACPTGALNFGELAENESLNQLDWFPDKGLKPAIGFKGEPPLTSPDIFPGYDEEELAVRVNRRGRNISGDISLICFSFLCTLSVSLLMSSVVRGQFLQGPAILALTVLAGIASLFHLSKKVRSWRAVKNLRTSPLSREIAAYIIYLSLSFVTVIYNYPTLLVISSVSGLLLLLLIDQVYSFSARNKSTIFHSGQTFLSALAVTSFITASVLPFVFISLIRVALSINKHIISDPDRNRSSLLFSRLALMVIPGFSLILHRNYPDAPVILMFLAGELIDRVIFYLDFNPLNIKSAIEDQLIKDKNEKKKYKQLADADL